MEIDSVLGDRAPSTSERSKMRYTEAVICEVQRFASILASILRRVTSDCRVRTYTIPANTLAIVNLRGAHRDPAIWPDPEHFNPAANFLSDADADDAAAAPAEDLPPNSESKSKSKSGTEREGQKVAEREGQTQKVAEAAGQTGAEAEGRRLVRTEFLIPFSVGKRECLGESLVRQELFIFLVRLLQRYTVRPPDGDPAQLPPENFTDSTIFRFPPPFKLEFVSRIC